MPLGAVAVVAKNLVTLGPSMRFEPVCDCGKTRFPAMFGSVVTDMIDRHELVARLSTTSALSSVVRDCFDLGQSMQLFDSGADLRLLRSGWDPFLARLVHVVATRPTHTYPALRLSSAARTQPTTPSPAILRCLDRDAGSFLESSPRFPIYRFDARRILPIGCSCSKSLFPQMFAPCHADSILRNFGETIHDPTGEHHSAGM